MPKPRQPLKRSTKPIARTTLKRTRTRIEPMPRTPLVKRARVQPRRHPNPAKDRAYAQARRMVQDRARGMCEARWENCTQRGSHAHHILLRSRGGEDEPHNLAWLCERCHADVHAHPERATAAGLMRSAFG